MVHRSLVGCLAAALFILAQLQAVLAKEIFMTVKIPGRGRECFYEDIKAEDLVSLNIEVLNPKDKNSINKNFFFMFYKEDNQIVSSHTLEEPGKLLHKAQADGTIYFCMFNRYSYEELFVYFEISTSRAGILARDYNNELRMENIFDDDPNDQLTKTKEEADSLKQAAAVIRNTLAHAGKSQIMIRFREKRNTTTLSDNYRVFFVWGGFELAALIAIACCQVYFIEKMFSNRGRFNI